MAKNLHFSVDLGVSLWEMRRDMLEAVSMEELSGRFAFGQIVLVDALHVVFSLDHTGQEPEPLDEED
ncbi:hypothetical protein B0H13DRAFT_2393823 [Mycena leptocephala]|nr:hypothetical protein B0H13DRAFT_2393823 [Mycena leptocephala]